MIGTKRAKRKEVGDLPREGILRFADVGRVGDGEASHLSMEFLRC